MHPAALTPAALLEDCDIRRTRASGPGGQHRNKTDTAIVITHRPTGLQAQANERRSQAQNKSMAVTRLRIGLAIEHRTQPPHPPLPSDLWQSRCKNKKIICSHTHDDFPAMLAEALDVLAALEFDATKTAAVLACSTTQLVRFIATEPAALGYVNVQRKAHGMHALRG